MRRFWAFLLLVVVGIAGCDSGGSNVTTGGGQVVRLNVFPARTILANERSNDGLAFTNAFVRIAGENRESFDVFCNGDTGAAMVIYVDDNGRIWAHYWDGNDFTPPVELHAPTQNLNIRFVSVLFFDTSGNADANAAARDGDALICWIARDLDGDRRLFGTYFDASAAASANLNILGESVQYGFYPGRVLDNNASDVNNFGFASDALCYSHGFEGDEAPVFSGDVTTYAYIVWAQDQGNGRRFYWLEFDLAQAGNVLPVQSAAGAGVVPLPQGVTLANGVDSDFVCHNGNMIWNSAISAPEAGTVNFLTRFGGGAAETIIFGSEPDAKDNPNSRLPDPEDVYAWDHSLRSLYAFFEESDDVVCAKSDMESIPLAREVMDLSTGDSDLEGTRIDRASQWILAVMLRDGEVAANVVQTRNDANPAMRSLGDSVAVTTVAPNQSAQSAGDVELQSEVADGTLCPRYGIQSNISRLNFAFQQSDGAGDENLIHNGVIITLSAIAPPTAPTFLFAVAGAAPAGLAANDDEFDQVTVADLGTSDGAPVLYYLAEAENKEENEGQLFGFPAGGTTAQMISWEGVNGYADVNRVLTHTTPVMGGLLGHGGENLHIFFTNPPRREEGERGRSLQTRYLDKPELRAALAAGMPMDDAFADSHEPPLEDAPEGLDGGDIKEETMLPPPSRPERWAFATSDGNRVGIYFRTIHELDEGGHVYYNDFDGVNWFSDEGGRSDPAPIDTLNFSTGLFPDPHSALVFACRMKNSPNTYNGVFVFFSKPQVNDAAIGKTRRWYVSVHE